MLWGGALAPEMLCDMWTGLLSSWRTPAPLSPRLLLYLQCGQTLAEAATSCQEESLRIETTLENQ